MVQLVSPGVDVRVIDESQYASAGNGTVPVVFIATHENKTSRNSEGVLTISPGTISKNAGKVVLLTSQRELVEMFGSPVFADSDGDETSEYGLLAAYSYLGRNSRIFVVRADVDLGALVPRTEDDVKFLPENLYKLARDGNTSFVIRIRNSVSGDETPTADNAVPAATPIKEAIIDAIDYSLGSPTDTLTATDISNEFPNTVVLGTNEADPSIQVFGRFYNNGGELSLVFYARFGSETNYTKLEYTNIGDLNSPSTLAAKKIWVNFLESHLELEITDKNGKFIPFVLEGVPGPGKTIVSSSDNIVLDDGGQIIDIKNTLTPKNLVLIQSESDNNVLLKQVQDTEDKELGNFVSDDVDMFIFDSDGENAAKIITENTLLYDSTLDGLSLYQSNGSSWVRVEDTEITYEAGDPNSGGVNKPSAKFYVDIVAPITEYPKIYRKSGNEYTLVNNKNQRNADGILFRNSSPAGASPLFNGMLWVDMTESKNTVRIRKGSKWLSAVANSPDGSGVFGRLAQRKYVADKMQATIVNNDQLRSETNNFTLICAPNYPEVTDELITLNVDRNETAFVIIDAPMRETPSSVVNWATNIHAPENGELGLLTKNPFSALYYPSVRTTNIDGKTVVASASHAILSTMAYNDSVGYLWFAPAGETRGRVLNGTSIGYLSDQVDGTVEYRPAPLNLGQRDNLYANDVNPMTIFENSGLVVWGQKTLQNTDSALDRVNVARLVAYLRERFHSFGRPFLFEQNDSPTRDRVRQIFENFLVDLVAKRALHDFAVLCDETNNTPIRIDRNELWIDVAIEPIKSVEFIYVPVRVAPTESL